METINQLTGEVINIPEKDNQLVKKQMNELVSDKLLEDLEQIAYYEQQIEMWKVQHKEAIKELFKQNNIKSFKNDYIEITYVAPTKRKSVDTQLLKDAGIYDQFCKESDVKESLRVKLL